MSDTIDTGTEVAVPDGEVSRDDLIKIIEAGRAADSETAGEDVAASAPTSEAAVNPSPAASEPAVDPKVAARILAATKAERRLSAERELHAKERATFEQERAAVAEQAKAVDALKAAKLSPSKALELLGMTPKEFLESLATEHEPAAVAKRAMEGTSSEVAKLQAKIDAMEKAAAEREHRAKQAENDAQYNAATQAFIERVDAAPDKYPHLIAEYTPSELAQAARAVADRHTPSFVKKYGHPPDDDTIAEYLEEQAKARVDALAERRARIGRPASSLSQSIPDTQGQPLKANTPRTLTNGASSQKATAAKPWTQQDADEESKRLVQQLFASSSD